MPSLFRLVKVLHGLVFLTLVFSCSTGVNLLRYEPRGGLNDQAEFGIHEAGTEWWYLSGRLTDEEGHQYFFQYTLFHGVRMKLRGYAVHMAVTDLDAGKHHFEEHRNVPSGKCKAKDIRIDCPNNSLNLTDDRIRLSSLGDSLGFDLSMDITGGATWHGKEGVISMGAADDPSQDSYYYSFPELRVYGILTLPDPAARGKIKSVGVTGDAWLDKQWGNFNIKPWFWTSIRFDDGDRAMLFYFPETGHREGTYFQADGETSSIHDFSLDIISENDDRLMKWKISFPGRRAEYIIEPYMNIPFHATRLGISYWEGICRLTDEKGNEAGWCVVEVTR